MALAENESKGAVVLVGIALLAVLGAAYGIFVGLGRPIDGAALMDQRFAYESLPMDLAIARAHRLGNGDQLVELVPAEEVEDHAFDRVVLHFFEDAESPAMTFPEKPAPLDQMKLMGWRKKAKGFMRGELGRGRVEFDAWDVMYIRERVFRKADAAPEQEAIEEPAVAEGDEPAAEPAAEPAPEGPQSDLPAVTWADTLRVNLSTEELPCVLFLYFPDEVDADHLLLTELLDGLELR